MKVKIALILVLLLGASAAAQSLPCTAPCDTGLLTSTWDGQTRYSEAYFPASVSASKPYPIMIYLHGLNTSQFNQQPILQKNLLETFANMNGVAIYWLVSMCLDSTGITPGNPIPFCTGTDTSESWAWSTFYLSNYFQTDPDDTGFIQDRISNAHSSWGSDSARTFIVGGSTGGVEAHRYATVHASTILGAAMFFGPLYVQTGTTSPSAPTDGPTNIYLEHNTLDTVLPMCGGAAGAGTYPGFPAMTNVASEDTSFAYWRTNMSCGTPVPATTICTSGSPTAPFTTKVVGGCTGQKQVMFVEKQNLGHEGPTYNDLCIMWNFFFPAAPCIQGIPYPSD